MDANWVEQLHRSLVDALRRTRPNALNRPVTVAEIYQDLVPYRTARSDVGFEMNADYEHTLLRLLAGEGDLARIEPREVRDKLRMELDSPNPDVGLFRNYAACDVWVRVGDAEDDVVAAAPMAEPEDSWEEEFVGPEGEPQVDAAAIRQALPDPEEVAAATPFDFADEDAADDAPSSEAENAESPDETVALAGEPEAELIEDEGSPACAFCGADLPGGRMVNFCPYCGTDQSQRPCPSCGEMLDPLWRFCIACGARVRPLGDHVN